MQKKEGR